MNEQSSERGTRRYTNGVLTVIAGALIALVAQSTVGLPSIAEAQAQRERDRAQGADIGGFNPADDRRQLISELRSVNDKLDRLISVVGRSPLDVNVVRMPKDAPAPAAGAQSNAGEQE